MRLLLVSLAALVAFGQLTKLQRLENFLEKYLAPEEEDSVEAASGLCDYDYDYPSCDKKTCLTKKSPYGTHAFTNYQYQIQGKTYKVGKECYFARSSCMNCLYSPFSHEEHLTLVNCGTKRTTTSSDPDYTSKKAPASCIKTRTAPAPRPLSKPPCLNEVSEKYSDGDRSCQQMCADGTDAYDYCSADFCETDYDTKVYMYANCPNKCGFCPATRCRGEILNDKCCEVKNLAFDCKRGESCQYECCEHGAEDKGEKYKRVCKKKNMTKLDQLALLFTQDESNGREKSREALASYGINVKDMMEFDENKDGIITASEISQAFTNYDDWGDETGEDTEGIDETIAFMTREFRSKAEQLAQLFTEDISKGKFVSKNIIRNYSELSLLNMKFGKVSTPTAADITKLYNGKKIVDTERLDLVIGSVINKLRETITKLGYPGYDDIVNSRQTRLETLIDASLENSFKEKQKYNKGQKRLLPRLETLVESLLENSRRL